MSTTVARADTENATFLEHLGRWLTWPRFIFLMVITFFLFSILFPFTGWSVPPLRLMLRSEDVHQCTSRRIYAGMPT